MYLNYHNIQIMLIIHIISASPIVLHVYDIHVDLLCFKSNDLNFLNEVSAQKEELSEEIWINTVDGRNPAPVGIYIYIKPVMPAFVYALQCESMKAGTETSPMAPPNTR